MKCKINNLEFDTEIYKFLGYTISSPKPKLNYVDVPFRDGKLDLTDEPTKFELREITIRFEIMVERTQLYSYYSQLTNGIMDGKVTIEFGDNFNYIWHGRVTSSEFTDKGSTAGVVIRAQVEPFNRVKSAGVRVYTFADTLTKTFASYSNTPRTYIVLTKTAGADVTVNYKGDSYLLSENELELTAYNGDYEVEMVAKGSDSVVNIDLYRGSL